MTTTLTPPGSPVEPPQDAGGPGPVGPAPRRSSSRVVAIIAIVAGALLLFGTVTSGVVSVVRSSLVRTGTLTTSADGLRGVDVAVSAAELTVAYGRVARPTLEVTGGGGGDGWSLERDGDTLVVSSDRSWWGRWGWFRDVDRAVLTLPLRVEGLDADFDVDGGALTARGGFGELDLSLSAGALTVTGAADDLAVDISAGAARLDLSGVAEADLSVSAGSLEGRLSEVVPASVTIDVSAGRVDLTLPDATYGLTSEVSAGSFTHDLDTSPGAADRIDVQVSAGTVTLRAAR